MAEENKSLSTKLNPDESEMEMQTEAQIALKAQQDQELRSIEMEIRELENKMKQRQIPFTSVLERNQFDELDIRSVMWCREGEREIIIMHEHIACS